MVLFFYVMAGVSVFGALVGMVSSPSGPLAGWWLAVGLVSVAFWAGFGRVIDLLEKIYTLQAAARPASLPASSPARPAPVADSPKTVDLDPPTGRMDAESRERIAAALVKLYGVPANYVSSYMMEWLGRAVGGEDTTRSTVHNGRAILLRDGQGGFHLFRPTDSIHLLAQRAH